MKISLVSIIVGIPIFIFGWETDDYSAFEHSLKFKQLYQEIHSCDLVLSCYGESHFKISRKGESAKLARIVKFHELMDALLNEDKISQKSLSLVFFPHSKLSLSTKKKIVLKSIKGIEMKKQIVADSWASGLSVIMFKEKTKSRE